MLRVPSDQNKENLPRRGGCGCNTNRVVPRRSVDSLQPRVFPNHLIRDNNALRDVSSQRNYNCPCVPRGRSKSSNEDVRRDRIVASGPIRSRTSAVEATSRGIDNYTQTGGIRRATTATKNVPYTHMVQREIRQILQDKQPLPRSTDSNRVPQNQSRPAVVISSARLSCTVTHAKNEMFNSTQLSIPEIKQTRPRSCSSINEKTQGYLEGSARNNIFKTGTDDFNRNLLDRENAKRHLVLARDGGTKTAQNNHVQSQNNAAGPKAKSSVEHMRSSTPSISPNIIRSKTPQASVSYKIQQISPILPNCYTSAATLISSKPEKLGEPKLKKRIYKYFYQSNATFVGDIYNREYLHDIFRNIRRQERELTLVKDFLPRYNPNEKLRAGILNWTLKKQAQLNFSDGEYYLAVNLFDHVLARITVPINMYQLAIMGALWIAMKLIGSSNFMASTLIELCDSVYSIQQLVRMEQKVLKIINFKVHTTEPTLCVNFYLQMFNLHNDNLVRLSVYYILDAFSLTPQFSSITVSVLAAACVRYVLTIYHQEQKEGIYKTFRSIFPGEAEEISHAEELIFLQLVNISDEHYIFQEPRTKYDKKKSVFKLDRTLYL